MADILVYYLDGEGLPRAWAAGPRSLMEDLKAEAEAQLEAYIQKKNELDYGLTKNDFTRIIHGLAPEDTKEGQND